MAKSEMAKKAKRSRGSRKKVRVAFVGAGSRARMAHYPSLAANPDADIVAVADLDAERLQAVTEQYGIRGRYTDYVEMIETEKPDVVYAILPTQHVYDVAATVLEMGRNLVVEKPPALTSEQTRQLAILARNHKALTGVTFQRRFAPVVRRGKALCEKRGPVHSAVATFYKNSVGQATYCRGVMDILSGDAVHAVDTLRYLCGGEVESVASDVRRVDADQCNVHLALVKFSSGATGVLLTNWMTGRRVFTVEIHSSGISCFGDPEEGGQVFADDRVEPLEVLDPFKLCKSQETFRAYGPYDTNAHFIKCVQTGKQPETNFEDALKTMELVDAIYQSQI